MKNEKIKIKKGDKVKFYSKILKRNLIGRVHKKNRLSCWVERPGGILKISRSQIKMLLKKNNEN